MINNYKPQPFSGLLNRSPYTIALIYIVLSFIWIQFSDQWVASLFDDPTSITQAQTWKGWFFVAASGLLIFLLVRNSNRKLGSAADDLVSSRETFYTTFEEAPIGIAHHRPNEKWLRVNTTLCDMLGYSKKEMKNLDFKDFIHPEDLEKGREMDQELIEGIHDRIEVEKRYRRKDGGYFYGKLTKSIVQTGDDSPYLIAIVEDISKIKENEKALKRSLREKEILLSEVHHRVKNNLALISALFELQASFVEDERVRSILYNNQQRVKCLSMVHETFTGSSENADIEFGSYIGSLLDYITDTFTTRNIDLELKKEIQDLQLNINQAVPCGLICNELLTNAHKYAFDQVDDARLEFSLKERHGEVRIRIADNGVGLPEEIDFQNPKTFGFTIVNTLVSQINADLSVDKNEKGTEFILTFEKRDLRGPGSSLPSEME